MSHVDSRETQSLDKVTETQGVVIVLDDQGNQNTDKVEYSTPEPWKLKISRVKHRF